MILLIVIFAMFGVALAAGWVAQLLVGRGRHINWTEAGWVGLLGTAIAGSIAWLVGGKVGAVFSITGLLLAIGASFVIQLFVARGDRKEAREERHEQEELTPEGLPGHHQPKPHHPKKKRRR